MINRKKANHYCCEDISKIENYEQAVNDMTQVWDCHHRVEIMPYGVYSRQNLIDNGLYWKVPAAQLIFLTKAEHSRLHAMNISDESREKMREAKKGENNPMFRKHHTEEVCTKISAVMMGNKNALGCHRSDETREKMSAAQKGHEVTEKTREKIAAALKGVPLSEEHKQKLSDAKKGRRWFNNGEKCIMAFECPQGFVSGRLRKSRS